MGDRAVDCARLESVCAERHPGFESPPIRHALVTCRQISFSSFAAIKHREVLPYFDHATGRQDAAEIYAWINHAIAPQDRTRINDCVATNFCSIPDNRAEFCEPGGDIAIGCHDSDFAVIELHV